MRRLARVAAWLVLLAAIGAALRAGGTGALSAPPLASGDDLLRWVDARSPAAASLALVRLAAEMAAWYLLVLSLLRAASELRVPSAAWFGDLVSLPGTARLLRVGLGVAATWSVPLGAGAVAPTAGAAPVQLPAELPAELPTDRPAGTAAMRPGTPPEVESAPTGAATMRPSPERPLIGERSRRSSPRTWTVAPGECFWAIAADLVDDALGAPVGDRDVLPYWERLIEANRARLVDPEDPDLILPGQVLELPAVVPPVRA